MCSAEYGEKRLGASSLIDFSCRVPTALRRPRIVISGGIVKHGLVLGLVSGALLAACMSAGVDVRPEQMATFKRGVTTLPEVTATLGPASVQTTLDDGSMLLVYTFVTSRPHPENYIPFIGALVGGADTRSTAAVFLFDARGVLKSANTTTSNVGTGFGTAVHSAPAPIIEAPVADESNRPVVVRSAEPPIAVKTIPASADDSVQQVPEEQGRPAPEDSTEPASE